MDGSVKKVISGYIEELEGGPGRGGKPVTFSIRLSEREHKRLVWLAERLGAQKTPLAEKLLKAALDEALGEYAAWAAPEDPEGFLEEARASMEGRGGEGPPRKGPGRGPGGRHKAPAPRPPGR